MRSIFFSHRSGFTLIELMLVVSIIVFLISLSLFPYAYSIKRSYVEKSRDMIAQEWILAHKSVKNGKLFEDEKHANMLFVFHRGSYSIERYSFLSGVVIADTSKSGLLGLTGVKSEPLLEFDNTIAILGFRGFTGSENVESIAYVITAPYAQGVFVTHTGVQMTSTGIFLRLGYTGASLEGGFARDILLRPYLQ